MMVYFRYYLSHKEAHCLCMLLFSWVLTTDPSTLHNPWKAVSVLFSLPQLSTEVCGAVICESLRH